MATFPNISFKPVLSGLVLYFAVIAFPAETAAKQQPTSNAWQQERAALVVQTCATLAPSFDTLEAQALRVGFKKLPDNRLLHEPEIVVSTNSSPNGCTCLISFGTDVPDKAVVAVGQAMTNALGTRLKTHPNKGIFATIGSNPATRVVVSHKKIEGLNWIIVSFQSPLSCQHSN